MAIEIVIKQSQYQSANYDPFLTNDESPSVHLSIINAKSNMDEEPLMGFSDMKTKPSDASSYSYENTSRASQINSMRGLIELSGVKPRWFQMIILVGMPLTLILYISTFAMGDCGVELGFVIYCIFLEIKYLIFMKHMTE